MKRTINSLFRFLVVLGGVAMAVAQQSPVSPAPVPEATGAVQRMILQEAPPTPPGGRGGAFPPGAAAQQVPQGAQGTTVQTIRSATRRQVNVAGQQAFEPILQHKVETAELPDVGEPVSIITSQAPKMVIEILDTVQQSAGWNIIASRGLEQESVRIYLDKVKPRQVMEALRFYGIYYDYEPAGNVLYVMLEAEYLERQYGMQEHEEFDIEHADVVDMEAILTALMSQTGKLLSDPRTGKIFVWDTQSNLDAMAEAVHQLDVPLEPRVFALKHLSAEDLLDTIESLLSERGLAQADPRTNSIVVTDLPARQDQIGLMLEALDQKLETKTWTLNYADPESISERLENILPEELGTITIDEDTYQISATAIPSRIEEIDEIIKEWDIKGKQVQIEAYLVSASSTVMRNLSINWSYFDEIAGVPFALQSGNAKPDYTSAPESGQRATAGRLPYRDFYRDPITGSRIQQVTNVNGTEFGNTSGNFLLDPEFKGNRVAVVLDYLDSQGQLSILSRPRVTVQDGEEAVFENTTDRPFQSVGFSNYGGIVVNNPENAQQNIASRVVPGSVQFITVGTILKVKPRINDESNILMEIEAEDSTATDKTILAADLASTIPEKTQNKAETQVLVNDGQTIVIGGLRSLSLQDNVEKFPILGDLPFVGRLFKNTKKDHLDRELAVFITPTIVDEYTQPEARRLAKFEQESTDAMRHSEKNVWGRTADRLAKGKNEVSIAIGQSGSMYSESKMITMQDLQQRLDELKNAKVKPLVIVRIHPAAPQQVVTDVTNLIEAAGLKMERDTTRLPFVPEFGGPTPPLVPSTGEAPSSSTESRTSDAEQEALPVPLSPEEGAAARANDELPSSQPVKKSQGEKAKPPSDP